MSETNERRSPACAGLRALGAVALVLATSGCAGISRTDTVAHTPSPRVAPPPGRSVREPAATAHIRSPLPAGQGIVQAGYNAPGEPVTPAAFAAAEARQPVPNERLEAEGRYSLTMQERFPDEYLFDGGDRGLPIHYGPFQRRGIETEDTIGEFVDHTGKRRVEPSTRVAVYAPRFRSLRAVSHGSVGRGVDEANVAAVKSSDLTFRQRTTTDLAQQHESTVRMRTRSRASGLIAQVGNRTYSQRTEASTYGQVRRPLAYKTGFPAGVIETVDSAHVAEGIEAARAWTQELAVVGFTNVEGLREIRSRFEPEEFIGVDDSHKKRGDLVIVKTADKKTAQPGDVITFTIRFANRGDHPIKDVKIIDNLTPRLEYVEESASSNLDGDIVIEDNREGNLVLRFELDEELLGRSDPKVRDEQGHSEGFVEFKARVR